MSHSSTPLTFEWRCEDVAALEAALFNATAHGLPTQGLDAPCVGADGGAVDLHGGDAAAGVLAVPPGTLSPGSLLRFEVHTSAPDGRAATSSTQVSVLGEAPLVRTLEPRGFAALRESQARVSYRRPRVDHRSGAKFSRRLGVDRILVQLSNAIILLL